ncbi:GPN-loop GTPase 3 [Holothuria leucospilota]|uniref:GPN-loop GTPase 3 n=1 Tax=Holothuria leucospilota TaxID=206669 RepID=A0A9Q1CEZ9_HOLLE|nr:GPN-loop GTPase 3 [Holothuria leucospilota]
MPKFAQIVMGPAGCGKSTYCSNLLKHLEIVKRNGHVVNLDPAAEVFSYDPIADIRELIEVDDVMEDAELRFGPNGGLVFCMEYFCQNFDWLQSQLEDYENDYIIFDCPGQIELYTHIPVMRKLVDTLQSWDFRVCGVFLIDCQFMVDCAKFFSGTLAALSAMVNLEIPHVNVMSKMDLVKGPDKQLVEKFLDPDPQELVADTDHLPPKFQKLNKAIATLIDDFSLVRFLPLDISDEESMGELLFTIDSAIQFDEEQEVRVPHEPDDEDEGWKDGAD